MRYKRYMKTFNTEKEISPEYQYLLSSCDETGTKPLFFDIETTGFSPRSNMVYLIGLSFPDENKKLCAVQFLAEGIDDERELLLCFLEMLNKHSDMILTGYNISSFDIPFLNARLLKYSLPSIPLSHRDLFSDVKKLSNIFPM
ncbi:MAG: ribonuclease H-like domain-containing protein, partial [Lachnospiraceae bacterium]|nr:ribonuclease H-like domain-containing protein [Lachnospiraceae bacterium]